MFKRKPILPYESYKSGINRVYTFLYSRIDPDRVAGFIPLTPDQLVLTQEQKTLFRSLLSSYKEADGSFRDEEFANEILGFGSLGLLDEAIRTVEAPGTEIVDVLSKQPVIAESYARSFSRFIPIVFTSERILEYRQNWERNICSFDPSVNQNLPMISLAEKRCIVIVSSKENLDIVLEEMKLVYGESATIEPEFPYIVVKPEFMPQMNRKPFPYTRIIASKLMSINYVIDAFKQNGVLEIQSDLARVISEEYRPFWNSLSFVLVKKINALSGFNLNIDRFLLIGEESELIPDQYIHLSRLTSLDDVYGFDPRTSLQLRKVYPTLWKRSIDDPNFNFFLSLSPTQQLSIAFLQYYQFLKVLRYAPKQAIQVYSEDLRQKNVKHKFILEAKYNNQNAYQKILNKHI